MTIAPISSMPPCSDRIVAAADRLDQPLADAGPGEDRLGQDRAGEQHADLQADHRDDRDQRVAQRVDADDAAAATGPWRARCGRSPRPAPRASPSASCARSPPAGSCRARSPAGSRCDSAERNAPVVAGQQRVDQHEAGHRLDVVLDRRCGPTPASSRAAPRKQDQQQAPPEDRHRIAGERQRPSRAWSKTRAALARRR